MPERLFGPAPGPPGLSDGPPAISAFPWLDIFLRILFARIPDSRTYRSKWESCPRTIIFPEVGRVLGTRRFWYAPNSVLVVDERSISDGGLRWRNDRGPVTGVQSLAASGFIHLPDCIPFFHWGRAGFCELSIRRDAARSRLHQPVFCAGRLASRLGSVGPTFPRQPFSARTG